MADEERPAPKEEGDTEGGKRHFRVADGADQPPKDQGDTDAEGHGFRGKYAGGGTEQPPSDESEGHATRFKVAEGTDQPPSEEAEGHAVRWKAGEGTDQPPGSHWSSETQSRSDATHKLTPCQPVPPAAST